MNLFFNILTSVNRATSSPVKNALLFYMDGQSNTTGRAPVADISATYSYLRQPINAANTGGGNAYIWSFDNWEILEAGVNQAGYATDGGGTIDNTRHGTELNFAYQAAKYYNKDIYIIKVGRGGTPLRKSEGLDHNVNSVDELHESYKNISTAAQQALINLNISFEKVGWIWNQGESDGNVSSYETDLNNKISAVRTFETSTSLLAIIARAQQALEGVRVAQVTVADGDENAEWVNQDGLARIDSSHFTSDGYNIIGQRYLNALKIHKP